MDTLTSINSIKKSPPVSNTTLNTSSMTYFLIIFYLLILNLHLLYTIFMSTLPFLRLIFYRLRNENFCLADQQSQIHKSITGCEIRTVITAYNDFHCRRTLSAGTASASSLAKFARCGVFGHVLFPQESPPYVTAILVRFKTRLFTKFIF